jgi:hypothetical protein
MTRWLLALLLLSAPALGDTPRHEVYRSCVECRVRCQGDHQCSQTCLAIKRSSCRQYGFGPGPVTTCSCT